MAAHSMAALVSSELANIATHNITPLARTTSTLALSQSPSSTPSGGLHGRLGDLCGVSGAGSSGFNGGHRRGFWSPPRRQDRGGRRKEAVCALRAGLGGLLGGLFKNADTDEAARQQYSGQVAQVNAFEAEMQALDDDELRARRCRNALAAKSLWIPYCLKLLLLYEKLRRGFLDLDLLMYSTAYWRMRSSQGTDCGNENRRRENSGRGSSCLSELLDGQRGARCDSERLHSET